ncbi:hypothetical protein [Streptomyces sp. NPDC096934]|uniref:hypothetical protein n=1 Tax=Streptomyces sp. NPDC096934 TaxID=3155551 RepID=UPI00332236E0
MAPQRGTPRAPVARPAASGPSARAPGALPAARLLGACTTGRANGLSPQVVADLTTSRAAADGSARPEPPVFRVAVLRTGTAATGLVPLLTGVRLPEPPAATDLVPLLYAHEPTVEAELRITEGCRRALDRLARQLLRDTAARGTAPRPGADRHGTVTWLRIRAEQGRDRFFVTRWTGRDTVARAWRRVQDVTASGNGGTPRTTPPDPADGADGPATLSAAFAGAPLPWPPAGDRERDGVRVTVTDVPVPTTGAPAPYALEILESAHLVLAAAPHARLAGREPLSDGFRALLAGSTGGPGRAPVVLVSCVPELDGADFLPGLAGWLRGVLPHTVGPFTRGLPVHAVSVERAEEALRVLLRPVDRAAPARARAEEQWAASGLRTLCVRVLEPALRDAPTTVARLAARRLWAALHDIRLAGSDVRPGAGGAWSAAGVLGSEVPARQLWYELDRFAAVPLARRAVRRPFPAPAPAPGPDGPPQDARSRGDGAP